MSAAEPLFRVLWSALAGAPAVYALLRALLVALSLLPPTTLRGATLPILARFLSASIDTAGREAGRAYAINTMGGVIGTVAAGFWLIPELGLRATTFIAAGLNVAIAAASWGSARGRAGERRADAPAGAPPPALPLLVAALSGVAALLYEIAWTRSLVLALGSIAGPFVVVPLLGLASTVKVAATINLAVAAFLLGREAPRRWLGALPAAVALAGWLLLPSWDPQVLTSGAFLYGAADVRSARFFKQDLRDYLRQDSELIAQYWDSYGLVTLHRQQDGVLTMKVNGKTDA